jgi:hypothetical protein
LNGFVGAVVGGFEFAGRRVLGLGWWWKRLLARGPQRRLWKKKRKSRATRMPFGVKR